MFNRLLNPQDTIVVDIDGTIANGGHRLHRIPPKDQMHLTRAWDDFNLAAGDDTPLDDTVALVDMLWYSGKKIVFMTGRNEISWDVTYNWLCETFRWFEEDCGAVGDDVTLIMRKESDNGTPVETKTKLLDLVRQQYNVLFALDDDPAICTAFRKMGVQTYQVRDWQGENK